MSKFIRIPTNGKSHTYLKVDDILGFELFYGAQDERLEIKTTTDLMVFYIGVDVAMSDLDAVVLKLSDL